MGTHLKKPPDEAGVLSKAIKELHDCESLWIRSVPVVESHEGEVVWQGDVEVFWLHNHPTANLCYAWSRPMEGSTKRSYVVVLHHPLVDSPQAAVRMTIGQEYREKRGA